MKAELNKYLKELRLPSIRECYKEFAERAIRENYSYEDFLYELFKLEYEERTQKKIARFRRESRLPIAKTLKAFNRDRLPGKVNMKLSTLIKGAFTAKAENILAFGNAGSGKTHLICALGHELISQGKRVSFQKCALLVQELLQAKKDLKLPAVLKKLSRYDAIVIDDIGYVQQSCEEMEVLFTLLADCYERTSIMLTSNLSFSQWEKIFKDPVTTAAAIDRLIHHSVIIELNLPSYRLEEARRKKGGDENKSEKPE